MESRTGNVDAKRYLAVYQSLAPRDRQSHWPEQLCDLANVPAPDLMGWVARQSFAEGSAKANMCLSFMRDKVLEKTAEYAMAAPENVKHTELFLKASGSLPTPAGGRGGVTIPIFNLPASSASSVAGVVSESGSSGSSASADRSGLREMDSEIIELSRVMRMDDPAIPVAPSRAELVPDDPADEDEEEEESDEDD